MDVALTHLYLQWVIAQHNGTLGLLLLSIDEITKHNLIHVFIYVNVLMDLFGLCNSSLQKPFMFDDYSLRVADLFQHGQPQLIMVHIRNLRRMKTKTHHRLNCLVHNLCNLDQFVDSPGKDVDWDCPR